MQTNNMDLTEEWQQGSDGKQCYRVKVESGLALMALSEQKPDLHTGVHTLIAGDWVQTDPPVIAWYKAATPDARLSISSFSAAE